MSTTHQAPDRIPDTGRPPDTARAVIHLSPSNPVVDVCELLGDDPSLTARECEILLCCAWHGQPTASDLLGVSLGTVQQTCQRHKDAWLRLRALKSDILLGVVEGAEQIGVSLLHDWLRECRQQSVSDPRDVVRVLDGLGRAADRLRARRQGPPAWQSLSPPPTEVLGELVAPHTNVV